MKDWPGLLSWILILTGLAGYLLLLVSHAYTGSFIRYMADDYSSAAILKARGLLGSQVEWYLTWSGRYAFTLAVNLVELVGVRLVPYLPLGLLVSWSLAAAWAVREISQFFKRSLSKPACLLVGMLVVLVSLTSNSRPSQVIYWQTGILTYSAPLMLMTIYTAGFFHWLRTVPLKATLPILGVSFGFSFVAGGFSETSGIFQVGLLAAGLVICLLSKDHPLKQAAWPVLGAGLLGALVAMGGMGLAPGNTLREAKMGFEPSKDLWLVGKTTFLLVVRSSYRWAVVKPFAAAACLLVPAALCFISTEPVERLSTTRSGLKELALSLGAVVLIVLGLMLVSVIPAEYISGNAPPYRAMLVPQLALTAGLTIAGCLLGTAARRRLQANELASHWLAVGLAIVVGVILFFGPLAEARSTFIGARLYRENAVAWDRRDALLRAAAARGEQQVVVPFVREISHLGDLRVEPDFWINQDAAKYYGLQAIIASGTAPPPIE